MLYQLLSLMGNVLHLLHNLQVEQDFGSAATRNTSGSQPAAVTLQSPESVGTNNNMPYITKHYHKYIQKLEYGLSSSLVSS